MLTIKAKSSNRFFNVTVDISRGYFSITGKMYEYTGKAGRPRLIAAGAIAPDFAKACPQYKDLCEMHLRNLDGSPMHPVENGCYYLQCLEDGKYPYADVIARHFQPNNPVELDHIRNIYRAEGKKGVSFYIDNFLRQRWHAHANTIIKKYNLQ